MSNPDQPEVRISQGVLRGRKKSSIRGQTYYSFLGIPYAKPPIGNLRFRAPRPPSNWFGIRDASRESNVAFQIYPHPSTSGHSMIGSEDCLYLNVFIPSLPSVEKKVLRPVMIWFHCGAFSYGSGNPDFYGPDYLMEKDVIIITFNYRLGAIGFLNLNIEEAPGNAGMKDQVAVLKWVKKEIAHFGGDPENITLFGESSGGVSVHLHLLSPLSEGLFSKAIIQSGVANCGWAFSSNETSFNRTLRLADTLGCTSQDPRKLLEFLRKCSPDKIAWAQHDIADDAEKSTAQYFMFLPTKEVKSNLDEPFLIEDPRLLVKSGNFYKVPTIIGLTAEEGLLNLFTTSKRYFELLVNNFDEYLPLMLPPLRSVEKGSQHYQDIYLRYFKNLEGKLTNNPSQNHEEFASMERFFTDVCFVYPIFEALLDMRSQMPASVPIYSYLFTFCGALGWNNRRSNFILSRPVVAHGDELGYLFHLSVLKKVNLSPDSPEMLILSRMTDYWTNFAKTGNPNPETNSVSTVWQPVSDEGKLRIFNIDFEPQELNSIDAFEFWRRLISESRKPQIIPK